MPSQAGAGSASAGMGKPPCTAWAHTKPNGLGGPPPPIAKSCGNGRSTSRQVRRAGRALGCAASGASRAHPRRTSAGRRWAKATASRQGVRADPVSLRRARTADDAGAFKSGSPGRAGTAYAGGRQPGEQPTPGTRRPRAARGEWPGETRSVQGGPTLSQSPRGAVRDKEDGRGAAVAARHARRCGKEDSRRWAGVLERRCAASAPDCQWRNSRRP